MSTTEQTRPTEAAQAWRQWRAERDAGLAAPYDWVSVVGYHWVTGTAEAPTVVPDVAGRWWVADGVLHVSADAVEALVLLQPDGAPGTEPLDGVAHVEVAEAGAARFATLGTGELDDDGPTLVEVLRRGGYYALRLRDPHAPARADFAGVPAFEHDESWVVDVDLEPYPEPRPVRVGAAAPGLEQVAQAVGEVVLRRGGREHRLVATGRGDQWLLSFSDATSGVLTSAWRAVPVDGDPTTGRGTVDLNRAVNYPYVFSDFGTCPRPVAGNHLDLEVTAGEKAPAGRTGVPPTSGGPTALPGEQLLP